MYMFPQPSSSGRAAQLVTRDGSVSFTGFDGLGGAGVAQLGYVPVTVGGAEDVESSIDPEFRMVMRKLTKRDAVTKLKVKLHLVYYFIINPFSPNKLSTAIFFLQY